MVITKAKHTCIASISHSWCDRAESLRAVAWPIEVKLGLMLTGLPSWLLIGKKSARRGEGGTVTLFPALYKNGRGHRAFKSLVRHRLDVGGLTHARSVLLDRTIICSPLTRTRAGPVRPVMAFRNGRHQGGQLDGDAGRFLRAMQIIEEFLRPADAARVALTKRARLVVSRESSRRAVWLRRSGRR